MLLDFPESFALTLQRAATRSRTSASSWQKEWDFLVRAASLCGRWNPGFSWFFWVRYEDASGARGSLAKEIVMNYSNISLFALQIWTQNQSQRRQTPLASNQNTTNFIKFLKYDFFFLQHQQHKVLATWAVQLTSALWPSKHANQHHI